MLDFIQFINDNVTVLTPAQKAALLVDFCEAHNYEEFVTDDDGIEIPNPVSRKDFANMAIKQYFERLINNVRRFHAEEAVSFDELALE